ncbi:MAG TPA: hypothetical protein VHL80_14160 [Polyangia bacterium]|nr:hypothetical protein [Polyangia bacterium]
MAGRNAVIGTLVLAFGLGIYSFFAIERTAGRRVSLVEQVAASMPAIPGARVISPWEPATYADDVRAMYCLDGADPITGASRAINALTAAGWTPTETRHDDEKNTSAFLMTGPIRLRGGVALGTRADCDGARHQVTLALDGTR